MISMGRMTGLYCISRGEVGGTSYWAGVEKDNDYEGNGVLPRTGSDEPVDSVVRTSGPDEPVNGHMPCCTGDEESGDNEGNVVDGVVCTSGLDEPVSGVTPCWTGVEECVVYAGEVALPRTTSSESVNGVTRTSGLDDLDGSCDVDGQNDASSVTLHRTGPD